jgi:hypothetical protein
VRLASCVALEAIVGIAVLGGVATATYFGARAAADYAESFPPAAHAAAAVPRSTVEPIEAPVIRGAAAAPAAAATWGTVYPAPDDVLLAPLREAPIAAAAFNKEGSTLTMRVDLANGARGAFKPEQTWWHSAHPRRDVAAYRIDRLLGIGHVPPVIGRAFPVAAVVASFEPGRQALAARRVKEEGIARPTGELAGSLSWWIPDLGSAKLGGHRLETEEGTAIWQRLLAAGAVIPDADRELVTQISTLILFDFVIDNIDRWNGRIRIAPGGHDIFFMDNTMSFGLDADGHLRSRAALARVQKFSRRLVARLRAFTEAELRAALAPDEATFPALLTEEELRAVLGRRDAALAYIDRLVAEHGEAAVLVFR